MAIIKRINHIAIAVPDLDKALDFWEGTLGLNLTKVEDVPMQKSRIAFLPVGDSEIELVKPEGVDSGLSKFIDEKGPGIHHICFEVDNLEEMIKDLKNKGVRLINDTPQILPGRKLTFIHPKSADGVLVELYELIP